MKRSRTSRQRRRRTVEAVIDGLLTAAIMIAMTAGVTLLLVLLLRL